MLYMQSFCSPFIGFTSSFTGMPKKIILWQIFHFFCPFYSGGGSMTTGLLLPTNAIPAVQGSLAESSGSVFNIYRIYFAFIRTVVLVRCHNRECIYWDTISTGEYLKGVKWYLYQWSSRRISSVLCFKSSF